jgi:hypothetical protein
MEAEKVKAGRFILATNILDIKAVSNSEVLSTKRSKVMREDLDLSKILYFFLLRVYS